LVEEKPTLEPNIRSTSDAYLETNTHIYIKSLEFINSNTHQARSQRKLFPNVGQVTLVKRTEQVIQIHFVPLTTLV